MRKALAVSLLAGVGLAGTTLALAVGEDSEPTVATQTFTNVVTYTIPTIRETVTAVTTVTVTAPTTTTPPVQPDATVQPGQSWDAAYELGAATGRDYLIHLSAGNHGAQTVSSAKGNPDGLGPHVTFAPAPGAAVTVEDLKVHAPHVTVRDIKAVKLACDYSAGSSQRGGDLLVEDVDQGVGDVTSCWNVTFRRVDFGPNEGVSSANYPWPQDAMIVNAVNGRAARNVTFDSVRFHDVTEPIDTAHSDCLQFTAGVNVLITRSEFYRCEHADIMVAPDQGPITNWRLEHTILYPTMSAFYTVNADNKGKDANQWSGVEFYCNDSTIDADYPVVDADQPIRRTAPIKEYVEGPC